MTAPTVVERWWLVGCQECGGLPQPFRDPEARAEWATEHVGATGHHMIWLEQWFLRHPDGVDHEFEKGMCSCGVMDPVVKETLRIMRLDENGQPTDTVWPPP